MMEFASGFTLGAVPGSVSGGAPEIRPAQSSLPAARYQVAGSLALPARHSCTKEPEAREAALPVPRNPLGRQRRG